jgi:16S rRNA (adenine1518-N6/adenine1519-N6)-dimethyltransferase
MNAPRPRKRFGQHFLTSSSVIARIIALINPQPGQPIVEIGPGRGALTLPLAQSGADLYAIEFDRDLIPRLTDKLADCDNCHIIQTDFLHYTPPEHLTTFTLVGNLPYNITSPVIEWMVQNRPQVHRAVFMVQHEMAQRLASQPNSKDWAPIALFSQLHYHIRHRFTVRPDAFKPPPNVTSAVIELVRRPDPVNVPFPSAFERVVRAAFAHRRKQLINNLIPAITDDVHALRAILREINLHQTIRAEQMSTDQFLNLTQHLVARTMLTEDQGED